MSARQRRSDVDRLKAVVSLVDVVGQTLKLQRQGRLHAGCCPFHLDRTPSFYVWPDHFHCFGCGAHGDMVDWLRRMHRMTFMEAVAHLRGGKPDLRPPIAGRSPANTAEAPATQELARRIWLEATDPQGSLVEAYLRHRGCWLPDAPVIRFHPLCPRREGALPAMVALMTDPRTGQACGVHHDYDFMLIGEHMKPLKLSSIQKLF